MSPWFIHFAIRADRFPRVSGDEPFWPSPRHALDLFSPRERG